MIVITTDVYRDDRNKHEPFCFITEDDGFIVAHRFEDRALAERTRDELISRLAQQMVDALADNG